MNIRNIILAAFLLLTVGCAGTTSPTPIDYDPELDYTVNPKTGRIADPEPTPPYVLAADHKGVLVEVIKQPSFYDEQLATELQSWAVFYTNTNKTTKCVGVIWRLMDFEFISEHPTTVMVPAGYRLSAGEMLGMTMNIDGVIVALPPSGYVHEMQVVSPDWKQMEGYECTFIPDEEDIVTEDNSDILTD